MFDMMVNKYFQILIFFFRLRNSIFMIKIRVLAKTFLIEGT